MEERDFRVRHDVHAGQSMISGEDACRVERVQKCTTATILGEMGRDTIG